MNFFKLFCSILLFILVFSVGFFYSKPYKVPKRQLASIPKNIHTDYSDLLGGSLEKATINRLSSKLHVSYQTENINIHLPHFQMQVDGKRGRSACEHFQTIQVKILADGVAVSGKKPSLTLKSPCIIGENNYIQSLQIPMVMFSTIKPSQMTTRPVEYNQTLIFSSYMTDLWPESWLISEVSFIPQEKSDSQIKVKLDKPLHFSQSRSLASSLNDQITY